MIFVTVGNHFQGFERLLKKIDEIAPYIDDEIVMQVGYSKYFPINCNYFDFVTIDKTIEYIKNAKLVVSHAGIGTIILCKKYGTPLILFPRKKMFKEHGTDHQVEIAKAIEEKRDEHIFVVYEEDQLKNKINEVLKRKEKPVSRTNIGRVNLIRTIKDFIQNNYWKKN